MLDAHPELAMPPETGFLFRLERMQQQAAPGPLRADRALLEVIRTTGRPVIDADEPELEAAIAGAEGVPEALRRFYGLFAAKRGKSRWGEGTPDYALRMPGVHRLLEEARFVHVHRDGRDVALSMREAGTAPGEGIAELAERWQRYVDTARRQGARVPYMEVAYEALVTDPEPELRRICEFVELDFDQRMLEQAQRAVAEPAGEAQADPSVPTSAGRARGWRYAMGEHEQRQFERVAGTTLLEFGHDLGPFARG